AGALRGGWGVRWAPRPWANRPAVADAGVPLTREAPRPALPGTRRQHGGPLVATHDYRRRLGSTSRSSSCGSTDGPWDATPRPGLPKADPSHGWASLLFGKSTLPLMATLSESPEHPEPPQATGGAITCGQAQGATRKQPGGLPSKASPGPPS
ncbi:PREDICTED: pancreatic progenitor cell differentiation and proliferation factor, partial [Condylura cristata]|uniref:pancreatic progenitor cell differentiation and proliferation factor n=1 Tax=Condylura cristata TaxID=143302 RepID=UPI0006429196